MTAPIRVGLIGTGFGRKVQGPAFVQHPEFELVALASARIEHAQEAGRELGVAYVTDDWRAMLKLGLTTFAEVLDRPGHPTRSDCHAWSASPDIELMRTVLGVDSAAPGFSRVVVRPHLGKLPYVEGAVPHPKGLIEVRVEAGGNVSVTTPVDGEFVWRGTRRELRAGANRFTAPAA